MNKYATNGHIVGLLKLASEDQSHQDHAEASDFLTKFRDMEQTFFDEVHPNVDVGLAISETQRASGGNPNIFTGHGSKHISDLIKSLDKIAKAVATNGHRSLTVLEAYILLCAAHIHDAANVKERKEHPKRCNELIRKYQSLFFSVESQQIYDVASVHGGEHPEYGKDTFRSLNYDNVSPARLTLLAAMLRLGDELSENPARVPHSVTEAHEPSEFSKLAHAYAESFTSFEIRQETLFLTYSVYPAARDLIAKLPEGPKPFWDFLEDKINTIESESRYCSQYGRPMFNISKISVVINAYKEERPCPIDFSLRFELNLIHGYPDAKLPLCQRSEDLQRTNAQHLRECFPDRAS